MSNSGLAHPTFFVPGAIGLGSSSLLSRLFPYFSDLRNANVVDVGPFNSLQNRAEALFAHILTVHPAWSDKHPVNLIGHQFGCSTISTLLLLERVPPASINAIVELSPASRGFACTHALGRCGKPSWFVSGCILGLMFYEYLVPEWVRRTLLIHTMLPPNRSLRRLDWSLVPDMDEITSTTLCHCARVYVEHHRIRVMSSTSSQTRRYGTSYLLPWKSGPWLCTRFLGYVCEIGETTDYDKGYAACTEDVSRHVLRNGHHDGVLLVQSQLNCSEAITDPTGDRPSSSILSLPFATQTQTGTHRDLMGLILAFLNATPDDVCE
jgi:hypothetical protein